MKNKNRNTSKALRCLDYIDDTGKRQELHTLPPPVDFIVFICKGCKHLMGVGLGHRMCENQTCEYEPKE